MGCCLRRRFAAVVFLVFVLLLVAFGVACTRPVKSGAEKPPLSTVRGNVKISGSGTCIPLLKVLAADFRKVQPSIRVFFLPGVHSGGGVKGAAQGILDVGAVSRELTPEEKKLGLVFYRLSNDALAVATHRSVKIKNVTSAQLRDVYAGKIKNWKELGAPSAPIVVLDRNEDESAKIIFRDFVLHKDLKISPRAVNLYYEKDMVDGLTSTPGALGYFSYGFAVANKVPVNLVPLDGVAPSVAAVHDGSYKMVRCLGVVTKERTSAAARIFVDYLTSRRAEDVMTDSGFAPYRE